MEAATPNEDAKGVSSQNVEDAKQGGGEETETQTQESICLKEFLELLEGDVVLKRLYTFVDEEFIRITIRSSGYNPQRAISSATNLLNYAVQIYPDLFRKVKISKFQPHFQKNVIQSFIPRCPTSPGILFVRLKKWKPSEISGDELIAMGILYLFQMAKHSTLVQKNGILFVLDIDNFGFTHARQASYDLTKKLSTCLTYATPIKVLAHFAINSHYLFEKVFNMVKLVLPEKARKNFHILRKDLTPLHKMFATTEAIPVDLGGSEKNGGTFSQEIDNAVQKDTTMEDMIAFAQTECLRHHKK